ncbi:pectate lyase-like adhesive domain-containing protein [Listeria rustica]|uniref:WxL domain-containing protein n=1 Tax=Listeria rustica TaxID=2713503 RepID=A0A7W1T934_9LIST|nr:pectate lyase-like adhesive domain-containing protein [Listeria rustica]MBA3927710.1 hypothetical protein [Listeria rustica]
MIGKSHILRTALVFLIVGLITLGSVRGWGVDVSNETDRINLTADTVKAKVGQSVTIDFTDKTNSENTRSTAPLQVKIPEGLKFDDQKTADINGIPDDNNPVSFDDKTRLATINQTLDHPMRDGKLVLSVMSAGEFRVTANKIIDKQEIISNELEITGMEEAQNEVSVKKPAEEKAAIKDVVESKTKTAGIVAAAAGEVDVYDNATFRAALNNPTITVMNVTQDFVVTSPLYETTVYPTRPNLVINGNGHAIDFSNLNAYFNVSSSAPMILTVNDLSMFGQNYYGPLGLSGGSGTGYSKIVYRNISYTGAQLSAAYGSDIDIGGVVQTKQVNSYLNILGITIPVPLASGQATFEVANINFLPGSTYTGETLSAGLMKLGYIGNVDVGANATVNITTSGNGGEAPYAGIQTDGSNISVHSGAKLNITTDSASGRGGIRIDGSAPKILVETGAELNVKTNAASDSDKHGIYTGGNGKIIVQGTGKLTVNSQGSGTSTANALNMGDNASIDIGNMSTFNLYSDGTGNKRIVNLGNNALFKIANSASVDLNLNNSNTSSRLISMAGTAGKLQATTQRVLAWNSAGSSGKTGFNYEWVPMFNAAVSYSGGNVTAVTGTSYTMATQTSFGTNFRTQNFKRVLFDYIPDVTVTIGALTNNTSQTNSHVITGTATPNAYIIFSGSSAIPTGTINSPNAADTTTKYHVQADSSGNYSFSLPASQYFSGGQTITATALLNGKSSTVSTVVADNVAPNPPTLSAITDEATVITGTAEANSVVNIYNNATNVLLASGTANGSGTYSVVVPVGSRPLVPYTVYYATATDAAGNSSGHSNDVTVTDTTAPTASGIVQFFNVGDTFTSNAKSLLQNIQDNAGNSDSNLTFSITSLPDLSTAGYTTAEVKIADIAGNNDTISIPVFVSDDSTVRNGQAMLQAHNFLLYSYEIPDTDAVLNQLILTKSQAKAWEIPAGNDITAQVVVTDKGGLSATPGTYQVKLSVRGLEKTVTVTVASGTLEFEDVTDEISFGTHTISSKKQVIEPENDVQLAVTDTRPVTSNWHVTAKLIQNLSTLTGDTVTDSLVLKRDQLPDMYLNDTATTIYEDTTPANGTTIIDMSADQAQTLLLNIAPGTVKSNEEYTAQIEWTLEDGP